MLHIKRVDKKLERQREKAFVSSLWISFGSQKQEQIAGLINNHSTSRCPSFKLDRYIFHSAYNLIQITTAELCSSWCNMKYEAFMLLAQLHIYHKDINVNILKVKHFRARILYGLLCLKSPDPCVLMKSISFKVKSLKRQSPRGSFQSWH